MKIKWFVMRSCLIMFDLLVGTTLPKIVGDVFFNRGYYAIGGEWVLLMAMMVVNVIFIMVTAFNKIEKGEENV